MKQVLFLVTSILLFCLPFTGQASTDQMTEDYSPILTQCAESETEVSLYPKTRVFSTVITSKEKLVNAANTVKPSNVANTYVLEDPGSLSSTASYL